MPMIPHPDIFMPSAFANAEAKRLIRGQFVRIINEYVEMANPPYLIKINNVVDRVAAQMIETGAITGYEIETMEANSQGYHIDLIVHPPGQYWGDMHITILIGDNYQNKSNFDRAMKGV